MTQKNPRIAAGIFVKLGLCCDALSAATELVLELFDTTRGVDHALFASEGGVRISSDVTNDDLIVNAVNCFIFCTTHSGTSQKLRACRNVDKDNRLELGMDISFHGNKCFLKDL
jgi:hypothetical protein